MTLPLLTSDFLFHDCRHMLDRTEGWPAGVHQENYYELTNTPENQLIRRSYTFAALQGHAVLSGAPHSSKVSSLKFPCKERAKCCKYYNMDS